MKPVLTICATCAANGKVPAASALRDAVGAVEGWDVRLHDCLSMCGEPVALAMQGAGKATYLFAGVQVEDAADVRAAMATYDRAKDGWIDDARPLGRLRFCLKGRVPK